MNAELAFLKLTGVLAAEVGAVILIAMASAAFVRSAQWRRTIWQICALSVLLVAAVEMSGVGRAMGELVQRPTVKVKPIQSSTPAIPYSDPEGEIIPVSAPVADRPRLSKDASPYLGMVAWVWLFGMGMFLGRIVLGRGMLLMMCRRGKMVDDPELLQRMHDLAGRLGIQGRIWVMEFRRLKGPVAFGLARKIVGLPPGVDRQYSRAQQEVIFAHELAHLAARDHWWQLLAEVAVAVLWWHPLVWLARRRLQDASETAADESSLLIQNGPPTLAECLLALGKRFEAKPGLGWLNIGGQGFRSGLGRRVQRLFELSGSAWRPVGRVQTAFAWTLCPAALVLGTVLCSGWLSPAAAMKGTNMKNPMWKRSLPAFAVLALLTGEKPTAAADKSAPPTTPVSRPAVSAQKGTGATMVRRKLEQIVFNDVQFDNLPLAHVIQTLIDQARKHDPEGVGVNILLNQFFTEPRGTVIDPATGLPMPGATPSESIDLGALTVRIMPPIRNVRLIDVLDAIVKLAERPIKYSIEDYGVLITQATKLPGTTVLQTQTFQITPPENFYKGIQSAFGIDVPAANATGPRAREAQQQVFQQLFSQLGIEWGAPRSIFFNELNGIVMVQAAQDDMALITAAMQTLGGFPISYPAPQPPQYGNPPLKK